MKTNEPMKTIKLIQKITSLNDKLTCTPTESNYFDVFHEEYGHLCILSGDDDHAAAEEIVRDALFDASEDAK